MTQRRLSRSAFLVLPLGIAALYCTACGSSGGSGEGTGGSSGSAAGTNGAAGATGSGGASGTGGATGSGGASGNAGATGTGGKGTGGATGSGGASGNAGATGTGGKGTGGMTGSGGSGAGSCPTTVMTAGDNNETITSGGESRTFIVHIPTGYTGSSPVAGHSRFPSARRHRQLAGGLVGLEGEVRQRGLHRRLPRLVQTKAGDNSWNAGYCCDNAEKNQVNDVQFARDIIKWLEANTCVDPKRIYASGGSNGGGMTYRLACEAADVIAAVAPVDFRCVTGKDPLANAGRSRPRTIQPARARSRGRSPWSLTTKGRTTRSSPITAPRRRIGDRLPAQHELRGNRLPERGGELPRPGRASKVHRLGDHERGQRDLPAAHLVPRQHDGHALHQSFGPAPCGLLQRDGQGRRDSLERLQDAVAAIELQNCVMKFQASIGTQLVVCPGSFGTG